MTYQIYVVDDHPMMRRGYAALIGGEPDLTLIGQADTAEDALREVPELQPDLLLADIFLGGISGFELVRQLKVVAPKVKILMASMHDEMLYAERAIELGAMGYVMKSHSDVELLTGIRRVLSGHIHLSRHMEDHLLYRLVGGTFGAQQHSTLAQLSTRQLEVFELIGHGVSTRQIAERLYISQKTVESHASGIKKKLGLRSATELMRHAVKWVEKSMTAAAPGTNNPSG